MSYYIGQHIDQIAAALGPNRYFYGLRKDADGYLYMGKVDQLTGTDSVTINNVGDSHEQDYTNLEPGVDFFEGILADKSIDPAIANIKYPQYKWDARNIFYYINDDGYLVMRINQHYDYPTSAS